MTPFEEWLQCADVTNDAEGDLVYDMRRDPDRPPTFTSLKALRRGAWRRYKTWLKQH
jgi:hypothetical protein